VVRAVIEDEDLGAGDLADLGVEGLVQAGWAEPGEQREQLVGAAGWTAHSSVTCARPSVRSGTRASGARAATSAVNFFTEPGVVVMQIGR